MLFNSGNPSLVGQTRVYAGDPSGAAQSQWTDQQIQDAVNIAYDDLLAIARRIREGWQEKISYADAVASTIYYALPSGFGHMVTAELSGNGSDLSSAAPADADVIILKPADSKSAIETYDANKESNPRFIFPQGSNYGILAPPTATHAGTNTIKLVYEASSTALSGDTDEPILPREFHNLMALGAAMYLKGAIELPTDWLERRWEIGKLEMKRAIKFRILDVESQVPIAGRDGILIRRTTAGTVKRI